MTGRGELTDTAWEWIEPLLPKVDGRGRPWRDHRQVVNGVLWRLRTGAPWRDLPERYGPWQTAYERYARWEADGTWANLLEHVQVRDDAVGQVEWTVAVDSTVNRAHQHAAGAPPNVFGLTPVVRFGVITSSATTAPASITVSAIENGANRFWAALA